MISESLEYNSEMVCMIMLTAGIDQNIIYEYYDEYVQVLLEHAVHQVHERCWGIAGSEVYLREITGTLKLVKQFIDYGKRILVLDHDFSELMNRYGLSVWKKINAEVYFPFERNSWKMFGKYI
ncbi:hypothetical protein CQW23_12823 [Capsicum baccatum]|uniref:Uncharacterized protein n=1 Tax=Capsicum baccatum TaxID=33114 RepID=A0A2G2WTP4_CAPBA|nr:hypothetical protein CQW23_12823 [Capsicum baccatum]